MIPVEEFSNNNELDKLKVGSIIDVYLERVESYKGEIVISREKPDGWLLGRKWKKFLKVRK